jgi:energy-coupling factor transporter ATP-binding protein EcfA2
LARLCSVKIKRYRHVEPTELFFGPGAVFLLGRNGSGKTTFLNLLAKLVSCDIGALREEGPLDIAWEMRAPARGKRREGHIALSLVVEPGVQLQEDAGKVLGHWTLDGTLTVDANESTFAYGSRKASPNFDPAPTTPSPAPAPSPLEPAFLRQLGAWFGRVGKSEMGSAEIDRRLVLSRFGDATRFDEALESFWNIIQESWVTVRKTGLGLETRRSGVPAGPTVSAGKAPRFDAVEDAQTGEWEHDFLSKTGRLLGARTIQAVARQTSESPTRWDYRGFDLAVRWPGDIVHDHRQLSFGQKRLVAFLWHAELFPKMPLFTDEFTNGLHAGWVSELVEILEGRQAFHAVQNPLLLDRTGPGGAEELPSELVFCSVSSQVGRRWQWRNPTPEEGAQIRGAWDAGFEQLSEVLLHRGLW